MTKHLNRLETTYNRCLGELGFPFITHAMTDSSIKSQLTSAENPLYTNPKRKLVPCSHCGVGTVISPWSLRLTQRLNV